MFSTTFQCFQLLVLEAKWSHAFRPQHAVAERLSPPGGVTIFMPSEERLNSGLYSKAPESRSSEDLWAGPSSKVFGRFASLFWMEGFLNVFWGKIPSPKWTSLGFPGSHRAGSFCFSRSFWRIACVWPWEDVTWKKAGLQLRRGGGFWRGAGFLERFRKMFNSCMLSTLKILSFHPGPNNS